MDLGLARRQRLPAAVEIAASRDHQLTLWSASQSGAGWAAPSQSVTQSGSPSAPSPTCASHSHHKGGPRAGAMRGGSESVPMCSSYMGDQHRPQVMCHTPGRHRLALCWQRAAQRHRTRRALPRAGRRALHCGGLRRCRQRRGSSPKRRVRSQHTKVAVPVRARRGHQRGNAVNQLQRCEGQLVCLGTTLVASGLAARLGAASPPGLHPLCEGAPSKTVGGRNSAAAAAGQRGHALQYKRWCPLRNRCGGKRAFLWHRLEHIGVGSEPPRIKPARGPPLWDACDAQGGEGMEPVPNWDEAAQPAPGFEVDQRVSR